MLAEERRIWRALARDLRRTDETSPRAGAACRLHAARVPARASARRRLRSRDSSSPGSHRRRSSSDSTASRPESAARAAFFASFAGHLVLFHWFIVVTVGYGGMPLGLGLLSPLLPAFWVAQFSALFAALWARLRASDRRRRVGRLCLGRRRLAARLVPRRVSLGDAGLCAAPGSAAARAGRDGAVCTRCLFSRRRSVWRSGGSCCARLARIAVRRRREVVPAPCARSRRSRWPSPSPMRWARALGGDGLAGAESDSDRCDPGQHRPGREVGRGAPRAHPRDLPAPFGRGGRARCRVDRVARDGVAGLARVGSGSAAAGRSARPPTRRRARRRRHGRRIRGGARRAERVLRQRLRRRLGRRDRGALRQDPAGSLRRVRAAAGAARPGLPLPRARTRDDRRHSGSGTVRARAPGARRGRAAAAGRDPDLLRADLSRPGAAFRGAMGPESCSP